VARALLVAAEDVADAGVVQRVVGREVRAAGDAEYGVDTFSLETFHDGVDRSHGAQPPFLDSPLPNVVASNDGPSPAGDAEDGASIWSSV
jgi:hypothetical protein